MRFLLRYQEKYHNRYITKNACVEIKETLSSHMETNNSKSLITTK